VLRLRRVGHIDDDFAGLGVVELLARFAFNGIGVRIQMIDVLAHLRIFLLQILDLLLENKSFRPPCFRRACICSLRASV
jgi:hypothetical protein